MSQRRRGLPLIEDLNVPVEVVIHSSTDVCTREIPIWLNLVPSDKQHCRFPLPPLSSSYLKVKDANMPVSFIKNYLVTKLGLQNEDEVEISMFGYPIISGETRLHDLIDSWIRTKPRSQKFNKINVGDSAKEFVMVLSYGRKQLHFF